MKIYLYSLDSFEFLGEGFAEPNPLEPGKFLVPANATITPPPERSFAEAVVFESGSWVIKPDFRGQEFFAKATGQKVKISAIGPLLDDLTSQTPLENSIWNEDSGIWELDQEKALASILMQRNSLLAASDWTQVSDCPLSTALKAAWAAYRQDLRDLPEICDIEALAWPIQPK